MQAVVLSQTCALVALLTVNGGSKERFFLLLVAKDRENPAVDAKNPGRWSRSVGGRPIQCILNGRLSVMKNRSLKAGGRLNRWSHKAGFILAGGHVRASAGALAVHTALIPRVCRVCLSVCPVTNSSLITPRIGTKFVSVDR